MPSIKPEPGMKYDFEVIDILQLPVGGVTSFAGNPSNTYERFTPVDAIIEANGISVGMIHLGMQPTVGMNSAHIAIATKDKFDPSQFTGKKLILRCTFSA